MVATVSVWTMIQWFTRIGFEMPEIDPTKVRIANIKHLIEVNREKLLSTERLFGRETDITKKESYRLEASVLANTLANLEAQLSGLLS
jgi:hypothetical protein